MQVLMTQYYGNLLWRWLLCLGVIVFVWFTLHVMLRLLVQRLRKATSKTKTQFDDLIVALLEKTRFLFVIVIALYAGAMTVALPETAESVLRIVFILALLLQAGYWGNAVVSFWINRTIKRKLQEDAATATSMAALSFILKLAIWTVVILVALDNMGVDITGLVTGLGIGGVAIALAVQNILSDLFASLSIIVDKPFVIGDFIIVDDMLGTVEHVGLKTTRIRSLSGEQLVFSNSDLLSSRIRNYKRMFERRVVFQIGVVYETPAELVSAIPGMIRQIIEKQGSVRFDRSNFKSFGDFSLQFETVYYVLDSDYNKYMNIQESINLDIMRAFQEKAIEFAFPTQTVHLQRETSSEKPKP